MTTLKMGVHSKTGADMVEVYDDGGRLVACIYPSDDGENCVHIVSRYFAEKPITPVGQGFPESYAVQFKRRA